MLYLERLIGHSYLKLFAGAEIAQVPVRISKQHSDKNNTDLLIAVAVDLE